LESFLNLEIKKYSPFSEPVFPPPHFGKNRNEIIEIAHFEQKWPGRFQQNAKRSENDEFHFDCIIHALSSFLKTPFILNTAFILTFVQFCIFNSKSRLE